MVLYEVGSFPSLGIPHPGSEPREIPPRRLPPSETRPFLPFAFRLSLGYNRVPFRFDRPSPKGGKGKRERGEEHNPGSCGLPSPQPPPFDCTVPAITATFRSSRGESNRRG